MFTLVLVHLTNLNWPLHMIIHYGKILFKEVYEIVPDSLFEIVKVKYSHKDLEKLVVEISNFLQS